MFERILDTLLVNLSAVVLVSKNGMSWSVMELVESLTELSWLKSTSIEKIIIKKPFIYTGFSITNLTV